MPDHSVAIAELEEKLNAAVTSQSVGGLSETIDLKEARRRLAELRAEHDGNSGTSATKKRRRRMTRVGFYGGT